MLSLKWTYNRARAGLFILQVDKAPKGEPRGGWDFCIYLSNVYKLEGDSMMLFAGNAPTKMQAQEQAETRVQIWASDTARAFKGGR